MLPNATYVILNMVYCIMYYLKKKVALLEGQDENYYTNLLYKEFKEIEWDHEITSDNKGIVEQTVHINQSLIISCDRGCEWRHNISHNNSD